MRAVKTLVLGKRIKIRPRNLVAASGRSCLAITFNICTITCTVANYVHYMISFDTCRHSCDKFVIWLQMLFAAFYVAFKVVRCNVYDYVGAFFLILPLSLAYGKGLRHVSQYLVCSFVLGILV